MSSYSDNSVKGLSVKDLVTIGIFAALFFVASLVGGLPFAPNPALTFYMPVGSALLTGPILLLLLAKVPKRGACTIIGTVTGIIFFALGMHWAMDLGYVLTAILADGIAGTKGYRSRKVNILAFIVMCLGPTGTYLVFFLDPAGWSSTMLHGGTSQAYIDTMNASAPIWVLVTMLLGTVIAGAFSGWAGSRLLKKQFEKAGITA